MKFTRGKIDQATRPNIIAGMIFALRRSTLLNSRLNTGITIIGVSLIAVYGPDLLNWAVIDAVWSGGPESCLAPEAGACWAAVGDKARLILMGFYPREEHWRPAIALLLMASLWSLTLFRTFHSKRLLVAWIVGTVAVLGLLAGGWAGLDSVPSRFWTGLPLTVLLTVIGLALSLPFAVLLALGRQSGLVVVRVLCVCVIELVRGVPLLTILFMAYLIMPLFFPPALTPETLYRAQFAIILFYSVINSEVIRGGLQSIPNGQYEAAMSLGLGYWKTMGLIVLPQAMRAVLPALVTTAVLTVKDTSLVTIIGITEFYGAAKFAIKDLSWGSIYNEVFLFVGAIYLTICTGISRIGREIEKH